MASDHDTVHVFSLKAIGANGSTDAAAGGYSIIGLATLSRIPRYFGSQWSSCKIALPPSRPYICAFGTDINTLIGG